MQLDSSLPPLLGRWESEDRGSILGAIRVRPASDRILPTSIGTYGFSDIWPLWRKRFGEAELPITYFYTETGDSVEKAKPPAGHQCVIGALANVRAGKSLRFDAASISCGGGKRYFGFEVAIFFARPDVLAGLFTLANFDEVEPDGVYAPFAAGCGSIVQYPYLERTAARPRAVLGMFDVSARPYVPGEVLSFAVPMNKFTRMIENMEESFLVTPSWGKVRKRLV